MRKVIVAGASGFVGKALVNKLLASGCQVYAVVRPGDCMEEFDGTGLAIYGCELTDYRHLSEYISDREFDAFFHLAWDGTFGDSFKDYHKQLKNAAYSADAMLAAVELGCKRFVLAGTMVQIETRHYIENDGGAPRISCIYGIAKIAAQTICKVLANQYGIEFNTAILASVYGEGDRSNMIQNVLIRALLRGDRPKLVSGENLYDWIYIEDVVSALVAISEAGKADRTYYVGHLELQTFEELVRKTRDIVAPDVELIFGELEDKTVMDYNLIDRAALYRDTGFECQADFDESIRRTAAWLKENEKG